MHSILRRFSSTARIDASSFIPRSSSGYQGYINGQWVDAADGARLPVINPATGSEFASVPDMGVVDVERAIKAAHESQPAWAAKTSGERSSVLRRMNDMMLANIDGLSSLLTSECGKPLEESRGEIAYGASYLEWFAEEAKRSYGDVIPGPRGDRRILTLRQAVGACALLTPWNFSSAMVARKIAPALAAGCSVVIRPSPNTPLSALALARVAAECGVPAGVVNVVVGANHEALAGTLCASPLIRKVGFTGSTPVGKLLMRQCAPTLKRMSLELGGNAPFIVFADADINAAVDGAIASKFRNAGQTCVCANRIYVHESVAADFAQKLAAAAGALKLGDGAAKGTQVGPMISQIAVERTEAFVANAVKRGAKVLVGGKRGHVGVGYEGGYFFQPTVLSHVPYDCDIMQKEIFGPVAPITTFSSESEVIKQANASDVGLAGYFYTRDLSRAFRVAEALEVGMVGVNTGIISNASAPFGGIKQSGFGREGSRYGLDEYTSIKYIMLGV